MKQVYLQIMFISIFFLCGCTLFDAKHTAHNSEVQPLTLPLGNNWQVIEEAPQLSDERGRLPFQMEQSVLPDVTKPVPPVENRTIKTPL